MSDFNERELDWNDEIEKESEFTLLPEGDYNFVVDYFKRGRHTGSAKLPACNKEYWNTLVIRMFLVLQQRLTEET